MYVKESRCSSSKLSLAGHTAKLAIINLLKRRGFWEALIPLIDTFFSTHCIRLDA
jgi:hypothetical protein